MSKNIKDVNSSSFHQEIISSEQPVLVDFWAAWCGPCRMMSPVLEQIAADYQSNLKVAKVNVDENQQIAGQYGIMSIPTLILFKNGKPINRMVGYASKAQLKQFIDQSM